MKNLIYCLALPLILWSCSSNENRTINEDVAAFVESNENVVMFGSVKVKAIMDKADYKHIDKVGGEIAKEFQLVEKLIDASKPIYFAIEGAEKITEAGTMYAFAEVKDKAALSKEIQKKGYNIKKGNDFDFYASSNVAIGISKDRFVMVAKDNLTGGKALIEKALDGLKSDLPDNKVTEILALDGDIVLGSDMEAGVNSYEKIFNLKEDKKEELKDLLAGCYSQTKINFENGCITADIKNYFSDEMKEWMFLEPNAMEIVNNLGSGYARGGFAMNLNMAKLQKFMNEFMPNVLNDAAKMGGGNAQMAMAFAGDKGLANLITGKMAFLMMGDKVDEYGSYKPEYCFRVGLGDGLKSLAQGFLSGAKESMAKLEMKGNMLTGCSSAAFLPGKGRLKLPTGCEGFGKKSISMFFNFNKLDQSVFMFYPQAKSIEKLDYFYMEFDLDGGKMILQAKDKSQNILKTLVKEVQVNLSNQAPI